MSGIDDIYTKLLMHMNGEDNGTTFIDEGGHVVTPNGNVCTKTTNYNFGGSSAYFDTSGGFLSLPSSVDFDFGYDNFTIEGWFYFLSNSKGYQMLIDRVDGYSGFALYLEVDNTITFVASSSWGWDIIGLQTVPPEINTWMHLSIVRNGNTWTMYKNGIAVSTIINSNGINSAGISLGLGNRVSAPYYGFLGYMDEVRISKGFARWTTDFTPPISEHSSAFTGVFITAPQLIPTLSSGFSSLIEWVAETPDVSTIQIYAAISATTPSDEDYAECTNTDAIPGITIDSGGLFLYIKVLLFTPGSQITPVLRSLIVNITP